MPAPGEVKTTDALETQDGTTECVESAGSRQSELRERSRKVKSFTDELARMSSDERIRASRYTMKRWELWLYAARYPDEVPLVNGELPWIALNLE